MKNINNLMKSVLKTAVYFLDQTDRVAGDVRDRVTETVDRAADRVSELHDQAHDLYRDHGRSQDHTLRHVLMFAAGVGVGIGAGVLFAPASGDETRGTIGEKVHDIGDRVRDRFSSEIKRAATGTESL